MGAGLSPSDLGVHSCLQYRSLPADGSDLSHKPQVDPVD